MSTTFLTGLKTSNMSNKKNKPQQSTHDPASMPHNTVRKSNRAGDHNERSAGSDVENPDRNEQPGKSVNIDDDPEQTKKKVPNMR
jgi:hypothetical protein